MPLSASAPSLHPGVHIGQDGFGFAPGPKGIIKVPQLGRVLIGDDVEVGANSCIDRGAGPDTVIGDGCKIDNLVQIGHNVQLGKCVIITGQCGIAGSTHLGDGVMLGAQTGIAGHLHIGAGAKLAARSRRHARHSAGRNLMAERRQYRSSDWHRQIAAAGEIGKKERGDDRISHYGRNKKQARSHSVVPIERIMEMIPHRYPFLMIDKIIDMEHGQYAVGVKNVTINEQSFRRAIFRASR